MIAPELKQRVIDRVIECKAIAKSKLNYEVKPIRIYFDLVGHTGAKAGIYDHYAKEWHNNIRINVEFLLKDTEHYLKQTVGHEVAHIIANCYYGARCIHDWRWRKVMTEVLELPADRCHSYGRSSNGRNIRKYRLVCLHCRFIHRFKRHHYNVIMNTGGLRCRTCRHCKKSLEGCEIVLDNG